MLDPMLKADIARDFVARAPQHPIKLAEFASTALPDAADWRWCTIAVIDKGCVGFSNGVAWVRPDGTAL